MTANSMGHMVYGPFAEVIVFSNKHYPCILKGMAYPTALRTRAVDYLQAGGTYADAETIFQVCRKTLYNWVIRRTHTGDLRPIPAPGKPRRLDYEALRGSIANHSDRTLHELGRQFGVSYRTIDQALKTMKLTRKKNSTIRRAR